MRAAAQDYQRPTGPREDFKRLSASGREHLVATLFKGRAVLSCPEQAKRRDAVSFNSSWSGCQEMCGEVGLIIRLHLLFGEVRSVTTALKVVEEMQEGLQEIERE